MIYLSECLTKVRLPTGEVDLLFQALADPSRRAMVERLTRGPASVSELARPLAMSMPAVVQHLHVLERSGLVRSEKVGRVRTCTVEPAALRTAEGWIAERRTAWEQRLDRLGEYLAEHPDGPDTTNQPVQRSRDEPADETATSARPSIPPSCSSAPTRPRPRGCGRHGQTPRRSAAGSARRSRQRPSTSSSSAWAASSA